jgi:inorganic pyrophosphatase
MNLPETFAEEKNNINVVVETPGGTSLKYKYDDLHGYFKLKKILPHGTTFPMDFGFIPGTEGEDGDPLDVLVIVDFPSCVGCVMECRVIGIIEAEQKEKKGETVRNDRVVAVATASNIYAELTEIGDVSKILLDEVIHFFEYYNQLEQRKFTFLGTRNAKHALKLIKKQTEE